MGERGGGGGGGGGLGLKSDVFFGLQVDGPIIGGVPIYVCVCVCVWSGGLLGAYMWVLIFYYRSPFSEESLRCLVAVDL